MNIIGIDSGSSTVKLIEVDEMYNDYTNILGDNPLVLGTTKDDMIYLKEEGTDIVTEIPDVQLDEQPSVIPMSMRAPIYKDEQPIDESMIKAAQQRSNKAYQDNKGRQVIGNVNRDLESEY